MKKWLRFSNVIALVALLVPTIVLAQTSGTTGALNGVVTDAQGGGFPGVTVTITSPNLQGSRTTITDSKGEYAFPLLPPGSYRAEFSLSGMQTQVREQIVVSATRSTKIDVAMQQEVSETITVRASQVVVDPTQTSTQQTFREDHLKYTAIGSGNRSYQNILTQAATVGETEFGNPRVAGGNFAQNEFRIDGVNVNDPVTHTFGFNIGFDAIQEVSILTFGKDAEYGNASGGSVSVIIKSGGNDFSGTFDGRYNDDRFLTSSDEKVPGSTTRLRFDKKTQELSDKRLEATLGGPIMRDKLWFFISSQRPQSTVTPVKRFEFTPATRDFFGWNTLGKLTLTPAVNQTLAYKFISTHNHNENRYSSPFVRPEANAFTQTAVISNGLAWDAVITPKLLASAQASHTKNNLSEVPISGSVTDLYVRDVGTGIESGNFYGDYGRTTTRDEFIASTTYYTEAMGSHILKAGVNYDRSKENFFFNFTGDGSTIPGWDPSTCPADIECGTLKYDWFGGGYYLFVQEIVPRVTTSSKQYSLYVQDQWTPMPRLTARLGLRYDHVDFDVPGRSDTPTFKKLQPRLGVAYDLFNNAQSVVHAYAGQIMDNGQTTIGEIGTKPAGYTFANWNAATNKYDPYPFFFGEPMAYDSDLEAIYSDEYSLGFTQKIFTNTSIDLTAEYKKQNNLMETYCGRVENGAVSYLPTCILTNQPGADVGITDALRSNYRALILKVESRPSSKLDVIFSWTHAKSRGSLGSDSANYPRAAAYDIYPYRFHNQYGYQGDDARDRLKIDGYYRLPWRTTIGLHHISRSGTPWSVVQGFSNKNPLDPFGPFFLEPRGSRRLPHFNQTDFQVQKDFQFGNVTASLIGVVLNVFSSQTGTAIFQDPGPDAEATAPDGGTLIASTVPANSPFGTYTAFQNPRRYELGIRFEF